MPVEKPVAWTALLPNVTTAIRSVPALAATNVRAAAPAAPSVPPSIERERSTATTTLFSRPRFCASSPATGRPFSVSFGGFAVGVPVTRVARTSGYPVTSTAVSRFAADAGTASASAARMTNANLTARSRNQPSRRSGEGRPAPRT